MNRVGLLEANEDDFLEAVRQIIRADGRDRVVDALIVDAVEDADVQREYEDIMDDDIRHDDSEDNDSGSGSDFDDDSEEASVDDAPDVDMDRIRVHDPVIHDHFHCPPFDDITHTFRGGLCGVCDCDDFCFALCLQENDYQLFKDSYYTIDFDDQLILARESVDVMRRKPNNELRKYFYKKVFVCLDFGVLEKGDRRRLPNCAVAKIRQIYPSETGLYMGFKEF